MRRHDREITDGNKIQAIISSCACCRLGLWDGQETYIVPLNFGFTLNEGRYTFYFHSAKEGRKIDLLARFPRVSFEMDTNYMLHEAEQACGHSARFQCVMGTGAIAFLDTPAEKEAGLQAIMAHNTGKAEWTFNETMLNAVCVFRLEVDSLSCKEHL